MKLYKLLGIFLILVMSKAYSGDYTNWAVPTHIELVSGGVLIYGPFGDPNGCGQSDKVFISEADSKFDSALSIALAAHLGGKELRLYSNSCTSVPFHWSGNVINKNEGHQALYIR